MQFLTEVEFMAYNEYPKYKTVLFTSLDTICYKIFQSSVIHMCNIYLRTNKGLSMGEFDNAKMYCIFDLTCIAFYLFSIALCRILCLFKVFIK